MQRRTVLVIRSNACGWADLQLALREMDDLQIVGEATEAPRGIELAILLTPDVIIAAAELEGVSLLPLLFDLHRTRSTTDKIIVLAARLSPDALITINDVRATSFLMWNDLSSETLRHSLVAAIRGDVVVTSQAVREAIIAAQRPRSVALMVPKRLTPRERSVLGHLGRGRSRQEIAVAERMGLRTVERIIADLEAKLDAPTPFVLGMRAVQHGLLDP